MNVLPQPQTPFLRSVVLLLLLFQFAICVKDNIDITENQKSQNSSIRLNSSTDTPVKNSNWTNPVEITSTTKNLSHSDIHPENPPIKNGKTNVTIDDIPSNNTGLQEHSSNSNVSPETSSTKTTTASVVVNSTTNVITNVTSPTPGSHPTTVVPTVPVHRKSKPEETHVDEIVKDSGPTTDYVVPLVVAMLSVPLVGVLCALLYIKGRDFWERRHYGRIDFLWDSRNDSRMDFLIDGMYNN